MVSAVCESLQPYPDLSLRVNSYDQMDDSYVVLESDGTILLASEVASDIDYGSILSENGCRQLNAVLRDHTLRHQQVLKVVAADGGT